MEGSIKDEILSKPLRQRFKFRDEVNGVDREEASSNDLVLRECFLFCVCVLSFFFFFW